MNLCPECRAGKRYIDTEQLSGGLTLLLEHKCQRCGCTKRERVYL